MRSLRAETETSLKAECGERERERELRDNHDRKLDVDCEHEEKEADQMGREELAQELAGV
jgi:hypothetical protein